MLPNKKTIIFSGYFDGVSYKVKKKDIASIGIINPKIAKKIGLKKHQAFYAELNWDNQL